MRRLFSALSLAAVFALASSAALAHDLWVAADNPAPGQPLKAHVGYGHKYPAPEVISDMELPFVTLSVIGANGPVKSSVGTPNYNFATDAPVDKGTYLTVADFGNMFWSTTPAGPSLKPKDESPGATACTLYLWTAKGVVSVGGDTDASVATKPAGLPLEIVPLAHPGTVKPGGKLTLQVLLDGKPLAGAVVKGRYGAFASLASGTAMAYSDTTDQEGKVTFVPLAAGDWVVTARSEKPYDQLNKCDKVDWGASLDFVIN
ncbi:MAG: DUF4198 domain-containing protein [Deltaproteobacteria bacterium]|nr:DUF4198 domain-containing protein [Deltaproteobacteria bacterium]